MKKSNLLLVIVIMALQGFFACKSDDISPQTSLKSPNQKVINLIKENDFKRVMNISKSDEIIYLKDFEQALVFWQGLKRKSKLPTNSKQNKSQWISPQSMNGVFTFPNGSQINMNFDSAGNIASLNLNGNSDLTYQYDAFYGYLDIYKWGIIAILIEGDLDPYYEYYYVPLTRWEATLNSGFCTIQYFHTEANLDTDGFGYFEVF